MKASVATVRIEWSPDSSEPTVTVTGESVRDGKRHTRVGVITDPAAVLAITSAVVLNLPPKDECEHTVEELTPA